MSKRPSTPGVEPGAACAGCGDTAATDGTAVVVYESCAVCLFAELLDAEHAGSQQLAPSAPARTLPDAA